jgi:hypothetical protein
MILLGSSATAFLCTFGQSKTTGLRFSAPVTELMNERLEFLSFRRDHLA